jgi:hypothetical protein
MNTILSGLQKVDQDLSLANATPPTPVTTSDSSASYNRTPISCNRKDLLVTLLGSSFSSVAFSLLR